MYHPLTNRFYADKSEEKGVETRSDPTNPPHYRSNPSGVECIEVTQHMNFCLGNAMKYLWRCGLKRTEKPVVDLKKAVWYINIRIVTGKLR